MQAGVVVSAEVLKVLTFRSAVSVLSRQIWADVLGNGLTKVRSGGGEWALVRWVGLRLSPAMLEARRANSYKELGGVSEYWWGGSGVKRGELTGSFEWGVGAVIPKSCEAEVLVVAEGPPGIGGFVLATQGLEFLIELNAFGGLQMEEERLGVLERRGDGLLGVVGSFTGVCYPEWAQGWGYLPPSMTDGELGFEQGIVVDGTVRDKQSLILEDRNSVEWGTFEVGPATEFWGVLREGTLVLDVEVLGKRLGEIGRVVENVCEVGMRCTWAGGASWRPGEQSMGEDGVLRREATLEWATEEGVAELHLTLSKDMGTSASVWMIVGEDLLLPCGDQEELNSAVALHQLVGCEAGEEGTWEKETELREKLMGWFSWLVGTAVSIQKMRTERLDLLC